MRPAIALLITLLFVMLISLSIGLGLSSMQRASATLNKESTLYQESMLLQDILTILPQLPQLRALAENNSSAELFAFLEEGAVFPLELGDKKMVLRFESAHAHFNINTLNKESELLLRRYFTNNNVDNSYVDALKSAIDPKKQDFILSWDQLHRITQEYSKSYDTQALEEIPLKHLFSLREPYANQESIDLNYATAELWELLLNTTKERAEILAQNRGTYTSLSDLKLSAQEKHTLEKFETTFFAPELLVFVELFNKESYFCISFRYNIASKKGYDSVFEV